MLPQKAATEIADLAAFDWRTAFEMAADAEASNPVLAGRIMLGYPAASDTDLKRGLKGYLESLGHHGGSAKAPQISPRKKLLRRLRGTSPEAQQAAANIDSWGSAQAKQVWADQWQARRSLWKPVVNDMDSSIKKVVKDLRDLSERELQDADRSLAAAQDSGTVIRSVMLADVKPQVLYQDLLRRIALEAGVDGHDEALLMPYLLSQADYSWREFLAAILDNGFDTETAWRDLIGRLGNTVERLLITPANDIDEEILPRFSKVLADAATGAVDNSAVVDKVAAALTGMIPDGVAPRGDGTPEVLVTYPSVDRNEAVEDFLTKRLEGNDALHQLLQRNEAMLTLQHAPDGDAVNITVSILAKACSTPPRLPSSSGSGWIRFRK